MKQLLASGAVVSERDVKFADDRGHTVVAELVRRRVGGVDALSHFSRWILFEGTQFGTVCSRVQCCFSGRRLTVVCAGVMTICVGHGC